MKTENRTPEMQKLMIEYFGEEFMESNDKGTLKQYEICTLRKN